MRPTLCAALLLLGVADARAGSIGFRVDTEVDTKDGLSVKVTLTQTGDEAASDVAPTVEFLEDRRSGDPVIKFLPDQNHVWEFRLRDQPVPPGAYAVVVRVAYADANGYPFEIISVAPATPGGTTGPKITGSFSVPHIGVDDQADGRLLFKRPKARSGPFEARIVSPRGLTIAPERFPVVFDDQGSASIPLALDNDKLLAGTSVNVFALISSDEGGRHQTDTIRGTLRIVAAEDKLSASTFYRGAAAVAALLVLLELVALRRKEA